MRYAAQVMDFNESYLTLDWSGRQSICGLGKRIAKLSEKELDFVIEGLNEIIGS